MCDCRQQYNRESHHLECRAVAVRVSSEREWERKKEGFLLQLSSISIHPPLPPLPSTGSARAEGEGKGGGDLLAAGGAVAVLPVL